MEGQGIHTLRNKYAYHLGNASVCEDIAGMNEPIQHLSCLFNQVTLVRIILELLICKRRGSKSRKVEPYREATDTMTKKNKSTPLHIIPHATSGTILILTTYETKLYLKDIIQYKYKAYSIPILCFLLSSPILTAFFNTPETKSIH